MDTFVPGNLALGTPVPGNPVPSTALAGAPGTGNCYHLRAGHCLAQAVVTGDSPGPQHTWPWLRAPARPVSLAQQLPQPRCPRGQRVPWGPHVARTRPVPQELRGWVPLRCHAWHRGRRSPCQVLRCTGPPAAETRRIPAVEDADPGLLPVLPQGQAPALQHLWIRGHSQSWHRRWTWHGVSHGTAASCGVGTAGTPSVPPVRWVLAEP